MANPTLNRAVEVLQQSDARSPVVRWLAQYYADLAPHIASADRPAWGELAAVLAEAGICGTRARALTGDGVRLAWQRVQARMDRRGRVPGDGVGGDRRI